MHTNSRPAPSAEEELNDLRSMVARQAALLESLETRIAQKSDDGGGPRDLIMRALEGANSGRPGSLTMAEIIEQCKLTKSAVHTHVNELEKQGKLWIRKTHDPVNGRPCSRVYHIAAVRP